MSIFTISIIYFIVSFFIFAYKMDIEDSMPKLLTYAILWPLFTIIYLVRYFYKVPQLAYKGTRELCYTAYEIIKDILKG